MYIHMSTYVGVYVGVDINTHMYTCMYVHQERRTCMCMCLFAFVYTRSPPTISHVSWLKHLRSPPKCECEEHPPFINVLVIFPRTIKLTVSISGKLVDCTFLHNSTFQVKCHGFFVCFAAEVKWFSIGGARFRLVVESRDHSRGWGWRMASMLNAGT